MDKLNCPNSKLLTEPWTVIASDILRPRNMRVLISSILTMAKALGEINRYHSKNLPDKYLFTLQKRMTELRKIVKRAGRDRKLQGRPELIPWEHMEYLFSGEERKDMKR